MKILIFSVLPSPYQRDLFRAMAARPDVELRVYYCEKSAPDSPWPEMDPEPWEHQLPGVCLPLGGVRFKVNRQLPKPAPDEFVILNLDVTSATTQWLMRTLPAGRWIFWGEKMRRQQTIPRQVAAGILTRPLRNAQGVAAVGRFAAVDYRERFPGQRIWSIPYHCDLSGFVARPATPGSRIGITFLFCGQMIARKGFDVLLKAFAKISSPDARLLIAGRETAETAAIAELPVNVRERIEMVGFVDPHALPDLFHRADVFVLPSRYEGWGVVVNQALGAGLPVLCSDAVGARELIDEGSNGWTFPPDDVAALKNMMVRCLKNQGRLPEMGAYSRAKAADLSPEAGAAKWVAALEELP